MSRNKQTYVNLESDVENKKCQSVSIWCQFSVGTVSSDVNPYICWYLSVRWLGVLPNPLLAGGGGCSSSPSDLEPGSDLSMSGGGGGGGARFTLLSVCFC